MAWELLHKATGQETRRPRRRQEVRWETAPGGEGTRSSPIDPSDPNVIYSSSYYGRVMRSEYKNGTWISKDVYPKPAEGEPRDTRAVAGPAIISPHNPYIIYHGFQYVFRSTNRGDSWGRISPDLTAYDPQKQGRLPYHHIPFA